ncbi:MAG: heme biosynthesis protein HemY [Pseudomonadota bacterium]|jgi:HemY protein|nr:heme biosynthesis protein HemY [Pseudomonadota bacterium]MDE3142422.1 heme biosynthesis protein HemY [Pseudomonadota bacterium]
MTLWRWALWLLLVALVAGLGWHALASDPGYVLLRFHGWQLESTVVALALLILLLWIVLGLAWRLLRWPFGAMSRRHRRMSRKRFSEGLIALIEGRHGEAQRALTRAARFGPLRAPALLAEAEAAYRRGEATRALEALDEASQQAPRAARVLRARVLRREGRAEEALALLVPAAESQQLPPAGWVELAEAALAAGRTDRARSALEPLRASAALSANAYAELEARVLAQSIAETHGAGAINALWADLSRAQRRPPGVVAAYARRAAQFGAGLAAMDEIETALARHWDPQLLDAWAELGEPDTLPARLQRAEHWLEAHPNDAALLTAIGQLQLGLHRPGAAREALQRALGLAPSARGWELLGMALQALGEHADACHALLNALRLSQGQASQPLSTPGRMNTRPIAVEQRDEQGLPRLPE